MILKTSLLIAWRLLILLSVKTTIAESPYGWCVGVHEKQNKRLATYHNYTEKEQERDRPRWGATSSLGRDWSRFQNGDVFGIYYDDKAQEIWFGLNGVMFFMNSIQEI